MNDHFQENGTFTRQDFLKMGSILCASATLPTCESIFADGLERLFKRTKKVLWIQGQSCSGCTISLLNTENPDPIRLLTRVISLGFHQTLGAAQGHLCTESLEKMKKDGGYILVVEGSIPTAIPEACTIAGQTLADLLPGLINKADSVMAVGTCASYGGIPGAEGNSTGALSVQEFMHLKSISTDQFLVNLPSCPTHPKSMVGTIAYLAGRGYPKVHSKLLTPEIFYSNSTHDNCPRYHYYDRHIYAQHFGDNNGCLFKLGCLGMLTNTQCPQRQWNSGVNWCIRAAASCIGCSSPEFCKRRDFHIYRKIEEVTKTKYTDEDRKGEKS
ncbi:MAG: hydrogenase small subunit [Planctomycetes bacterium]|nr:hydrogenase small subunit [Planctomycetota bacterium]